MKTNFLLGKNTDFSIFFVYFIKNFFGYSSLEFYSGIILCLIICFVLGSVGNIKVGGYVFYMEKCKDIGDKIYMYTEIYMYVIYIRIF